MNGMLVLRHALEMAVLFPAAYFALLPVRDDLRYPPRRLYWIAGGMIVLIIAVSAPLCAAKGGYQQPAVPRYGSVFGRLLVLCGSCAVQKAILLF